MTTNSMQINVEMVHWDRVSHLMNLMLVHPDTNDMVMVFVMQQQRLVDNINQQLMVVLQVDLDQRQQQLQHMAIHQYMVDHHIIFGMLHNYQPQLIILIQRQFDVSILFCFKMNKKKKERKIKPIKFIV